MIQVTELGYVGLGVKDLAEWKRFAAEIVGLEVSDEGEAGRSYLRMDYWHHRILLDEDGADDLKVLGFRVAGAEEFQGMAEQLSEAGVAVEIASPAAADDRRVLELMTLEDASGFPIEIFHGPQVQADRRPRPQDARLQATQRLEQPFDMLDGLLVDDGCRLGGRCRSEFDHSDIRHGRQDRLAA